jgi:hypothetical protein
MNTDNAKKAAIGAWMDAEDELRALRAELERLQRVQDIVDERTRNGRCVLCGQMSR